MPEASGPEPVSRRRIARQFVLPTIRQNKLAALGVVLLSVALSVVPALKTELESAVINGINEILTDGIEGSTFADALAAPVQSLGSGEGFEGFVLGIASVLFENATLGDTAVTYGILTVVAALLAWSAVALRAHLERVFFTTLRGRAMETLMDPSAASLPLQKRDERGVTVQQGAVNIAAAYTSGLQLVQYLLALGVTAGVLFSRDARLAGAIIAVVAAQTILTFIKTFHLREQRHELEEQRDDVVRKSDDIIENRDFIAAHEQRDYFHKKLHALATAYGKIEQKLTLRDQGYRQFAGVLFDAGRLAILFLAVAITMGVFGERPEARVDSIGDAYFLLALYVRMLTPTQGILNVWDGYVRQRDISRRFRALLSASDELPPAQGEETAEDGAAPEAAEFKHVHYAYPTKDGYKDALRGCTFKVPRGKTTLIVGRSGSGKTTIARMLLGFIQPDDGIVEVFGKDVAAWDNKELLERMSYLAQADHVVDDSVRVNLFAEKRTDEERWQVLSRVGLHDARLDDQATALSTGQKQRVGLARLLLDQEEIVLMDEPLSGVDAFTLMELDEELGRYFAQDRTFVVISHRLMFTSYADHVVVLDNGVALEQGSPEKLMGDGGKFASLVRAARRELGP